MVLQMDADRTEKDLPLFLQQSTTLFNIRFTHDRSRKMKSNQIRIKIQNFGSKFGFDTITKFEENGLPLIKLQVSQYIQEYQTLLYINNL